MSTTTARVTNGARVPVDRVPVSLLTGFLGAGKTTLLNQWVRQPELAGVAVLVNEFGDVGVDHHLVAEMDEQMVLLDSGCLCCAMQGDLIGALKSLALRSARREIAPVTRVIVETSGLADPVPVIYTLMEDAFVAARYVCDGVVTAVSATHGLAQLGAYSEAVRQVVVADRLLITKCELAGSSELAALGRQLQSLNPGARQSQVRNGTASAEALLSCGLYAASGRPPSVAAWLGEEALRSAQRDDAGAPFDLTPGDEGGDDDASGPYLMARWRARRDRRAADAARLASGHSPGVSSFVVRFDRELPWLGFAVAMGRVLRSHGASLLRVKGLLSVIGDPRPQVIQCVQGVAYPTVRLPAWPREGPFQDGRGRLVFIARDLGEAQIEAIRSALSELLADTAALRSSAGDLTLPTRCWLAQRMPVSLSRTVQHAGWFVQSRNLRSPAARG
ncbi:MAG TPA: GTP-binding protein [Methylibium sp.]|nr:GTP-binding protein [Methylibium sp.]